MFRMQQSRPSYRVVADLISSDGTFVTQTVQAGLQDYDDVEAAINEIKSNPPEEFKLFSRVSPRWEMSFA